MTKPTRATLALLLPLPVLAFAALPPRGPEVELEEAEVFIEFNSTDQDFGIQLFWDGAAWSEMTVEDPSGGTALDVRVRGSLALQGLTEGFFESAEPPITTLSMEEFLARFPEGEYDFEGTTLGGEELTGEAEFTHTIPAPPTNLSPAEGAVVNPRAPLVASFDAVSRDLEGNPLAPEQYEVVLETENGILRVFSIVLSGDLASPSVTVPPEFLVPGTEYKLEVIVQEESGNRTISETTFDTSR